jgi:hypothetical protein
MGAVKILYSEWLLPRPQLDQSMTIYNTIAPLLQDKDRLLVQEVTRHAVWSRALIRDETLQKLLAEARG